MIPLAVNLLPADAHLAVCGIKVALGTIDLFKTAGEHGAVVLHIVGGLAVKYQRVLLHAVVLIVVPDTVELFPAVRRNFIREVHELEVNVHIALHARHTAGVRALPHHIAVVLRHALVGGDPDRVLRERVHIEFVLQPVVVRVEYGVVARIADLLAKGVDNLGHLIFRESTERFFIFRVEGNRIGDGIVLDELQNEVRLLCRLLGCGRIGVNVGAQFDACLDGIVRVLAELRVGVPFVAGAEHHEVHIVRGCFLPVDIALPVTHIHTAVSNAVNRGTSVKETVSAFRLAGQLICAVGAQAERKEQGSAQRCGREPFDRSLHESLNSSLRRGLWSCRSEGLFCRRYSCLRSLPPASAPCRCSLRLPERSRFRCKRRCRRRYSSRRSA